VNRSALNRTNGIIRSPAEDSSYEHFTARKGKWYDGKVKMDALCVPS